jgi:starch synthase
VAVRDPAALSGAIGGLLTDRTVAAAMGAAGRERALDRFDEAAVVERTMQVYRRLLGRHGIPAPEGVRP